MNQHNNKKIFHCRTETDGIYGEVLHKISKNVGLPVKTLVAISLHTFATMADDDQRRSIADFYNPDKRIVA